MNFTQVALNMQISFIPKQPFHSILNATSPPSRFIAITSALWLVTSSGPLPQTYFLYVFSIYILLQERYLGQDVFSLKNYICYFIHFFLSLHLFQYGTDGQKFLPLDLSLFSSPKNYCHWPCLIYLISFGRSFVPGFNSYADKMAKWMDIKARRWLVNWCFSLLFPKFLLLYLL